MSVLQANFIAFYIESRYDIRDSNYGWDVTYGIRHHIYLSGESLRD